MSRIEHSRGAAYRGRALALIMTALFAGACGDDDKTEDGDGGGRDAARPDAGRDAGTDAGRDAGMDAGPDAGQEVDAGFDAGTPAVEGEMPPVLSKVVYDKDPKDPGILIAGSDPNGDIESFTITFYKDGNPVNVIDTDGESTTLESSTYTPASKFAKSEYADFFYFMMPTPPILADVDKISVVLTDAGGRTSASMDSVAPTARNSGQSCDPRGFEKCKAPNVCTPQGSGFTCQAVNSARMSACTAAPSVTITGPGMSTISGTLNKTSLWDGPPSGCEGGAGETTGFNDRVVKLKVETQLSKITISPGDAPKFDTTLYKLDSCTTDLSGCVNNCACSGDVLTLTSIPPGDHFIVVDSYPSVGPTGTDFTLTITAE